MQVAQESILETLESCATTTTKKEPRNRGAYRRVGRRGDAHHSIVEWMLYEEGCLSLRYISCALPVFTLVARDIEVTLNDVMIRNELLAKTSSVNYAGACDSWRTVASSKKYIFAGKF